MGTVICCDRCPKSFHYTCVNPPLEEVVDLDSWFCNKCQNQINPKPRHAKGLFSDLMDNVDRKNPTSFSLPKKLRDYFEGVSTGKHGEYIDTTDARTGKSRYGFPVIFIAAVANKAQDCGSRSLQVDYERWQAIVMPQV